MKPKSANPDDLKIGGNLRFIRVARGVSQEKLAEALGITFQQVQKYEKGANRISASRLVQITNALNCTLDDLFAGTSGASSKPLSLPTVSKQASRIASVFDRIKSPVTRAKLVELVVSIANEDSAPC